MKTEVFFTQFFPERENLFSGTAVVMIDILRASTTVCAALYNGAREVIPVDSPDKAVRIYNSLSREARFLGGERNGIKPAGFDAGNSPSEYSPEAIRDKTVILSTTNGTKIFGKAGNARIKIIAGFVNISLVTKLLSGYIQNNNEINSGIFFLCAGSDGRFSYEDTLFAGSILNSLIELGYDLKLTDSAHAALSLYRLNLPNLKDFIETREHATMLKEYNFGEDIRTALTYDLFPVIPVISGSSITKLEKLPE